MILVAISISTDHLPVISRRRSTKHHRLRIEVMHCAQALMMGETVQGYWFDETQAYAARRRGEDSDRMRFATLETLLSYRLTQSSFLHLLKIGEGRGPMWRSRTRRPSGQGGLP